METIIAGKYRHERSKNDISAHIHVAVLLLSPVPLKCLESISAMNLIIKSKLANCKAITGGYWLTGLINTNTTSMIIIKDYFSHWHS